MEKTITYYSYGDCPNPDFLYAGCRYTFATFVFKKNAGGTTDYDREVLACYQEILGRYPDSDEDIHWKTMKTEIASVKNALLTSYEYQQKRFYERRKLVNLQRFKIYVMVDDLDVGLQIMRGNSYEPHVTQSLINILKSGDVFVDVGANIGFLTLLAASIVQSSGKVISFEPNVQNLQLIYASILENNFENIRVYPFAVSDSQQIMKIKHFCSNGFLESPTSDQKNIQLVQTVRIDELLQSEKQINVIKMDIEGYEPSALRGMDNLIRKHRPIIFTEFSPWHIKHRCNIDPQAYLKQVESFNYRLSIIETSGNIIDNLDADSVMNFWKKLNNDKMQLDIIAKPL